MNDAEIKDILTSVKSIALVGASKKPERPSYRVMKFLIDQGYDLYPVNPGLAGSELLGRQVYASLSDIPVPIDMVDIFRASDKVGPVVKEAIEKNANVVWMQLGVMNKDAAETAKHAGLKVVMDRCPAIEIPRLAIDL